MSNVQMGEFMPIESESRMTVRMSSDLYEWLKEDAESSLRSLNSQVVAILNDYRKRRVNESSVGVKVGSEN